jgi:hypothetical protein
LEAEATSRIYNASNDKQDFPFDFNKSWHTEFFKKLTEGVPKDEIDSIFENVSVITFNYDRCIEHFLHNALMFYYGINDARAGQLMSKLRIHHPYGQVGYLPWQSARQPSVPFGGERNGRSDILALAGQIKTFTEQIEEGDELSAIRTAVRDAETVVFLGFAFADQNMKLLNPSTATAVRHVFATAYGMSDSDRVDVERSIAHVFGRRPLGEGHWLNLVMEVRRDLTCVKLFHEYSRSMAR